MKIDELKRIAEENDYEQLENKHNQLKHQLEFRRNAGGLENIVNRIAIREGIENRIFFSINYCNEKDLNMIKATIKYAETPVEDREEEKKFYLKHKWIVNSAAGEGYLNWFLHDDIMILSSTLQDSSAKTQFTLKEIEEIKEKFDTNLADFELVEVVDED